jgi:hypothetical protein
MNSEQGQDVISLLIIKMKKNLLSKISKLAIIPALAFSLNNNEINAQKRFETEIGMHMDFKASHHPDFEVPDDWLSHMRDLNYYYEETLDLKDSKTYFFPDVYFSFVPHWELSNGTEVGIYTDVGLHTLRGANYVSKAEVLFGKNNNHKYNVKDFTVQKLSPDIGPIVRIPLKTKEERFLEFKLTGAPYRMYNRDYESLIITGGWVSPISNDSYRDELIEKGMSYKLSAGIFTKTDKWPIYTDDNYFGVYVEKIGKAIQAGISFGLYVDTDELKK